MNHYFFSIDHYITFALAFHPFLFQRGCISSWHLSPVIACAGVSLALPKSAHTLTSIPRGNACCGGGENAFLLPTLLLVTNLLRWRLNSLLTIWALLCKKWCHCPCNMIQRKRKALELFGSWTGCVNNYLQVSLFLPVFVASLELVLYYLLLKQVVYHLVSILAGLHSVASPTNTDATDWVIPPFH